MKWTPRLRTVLLIVNIVILAMPLVAIGALRIYESELVRQTEAELIAQGAFVEATYRGALLSELDARGERVDEYGAPATAEIKMVDGKFIPFAPNLDLSDERVRPPAPDPVKPRQPPPPIPTVAGDRLSTILHEAQRITFAGIRVVDADGTIVASTGGQIGWSVSQHEEVRRALTGEFVSLLRARISDNPQPPLESISRRTKVRVFVAMPILVDDRVVGAVVLSRTPMSFAKALYENRVLFFAMLAALLAGVALITILTLFTIRRPIKALIRQTRRIAHDPADNLVIEHPGTREFQELSEAFAKMATSLREREEYITTFARNVSHEFKTPLSSIRGSVELLQDHLDEMAPDEREEFLEVVARDCDRLDRLVERLLELARADVLRPGAEVSDVEMVAASVTEDFQSADFNVTLESSAEGANVAMSQETLESLLSNLLGNARQHGGNSAKVVVRIIGEHVEIEVSDDGPGIDASNATRIFEEFFTTARDSGGTGLGLAIIHTLVESHGGQIVLVEPACAKFSVLLPRH